MCRDCPEAPLTLLTSWQVHNTPVASFSLGAERTFAFCKDAYSQAGMPMYGRTLPDRCMVLMRPECNLSQPQGYAHALLRGAAGQDGVRYNLTFRVTRVGSDAVQAHK